MSNFGKSFASLVKSNNGFFKSEKQQEFLIDQCQEVNYSKERAIFYAGGDVYGNSYTMIYVCDFDGVLRVEKYTPKTSKTVTTWERQSDKEFKQAQNEKAKARAEDIAEHESTMAKYARLEELEAIEKDKLRLVMDAALKDDQDKIKEAILNWEKAKSVTDVQLKSMKLARPSK